MNALLIGGIGYVGGRLSAHLKAHGHHVAVTTRRAACEVPTWLQADDVIAHPLADLPATALRGRDIIFYLAAPDEVSAEKNPRLALQAGAEGTWHFLQTLLDAGISKTPILFLSTFHVYGKNVRDEITEETWPYPVHPYALSRYFGECTVQAFRARHHWPALCVRMSNSFGAPAGFDVPRWSLIFNDLCLQAVKNDEIVLKTAGLQTRNFITLHDATRALEFLGQRADAWPEDGLLHLGSTIQLSMLQVANMIQEGCQALWGKSPRLVRPEAGARDRPALFHFQTQRLAAMGFTWDNPIMEEIKATLELCHKALHLAATRR